MLRSLIARLQRLNLSLRQRYCRFLIILLMGLWLTVGGAALSQQSNPQDGGNPIVSQQVEAGRSAYAEQAFEEAIALWTQALQQYTEQSDPRHQAMVLTYLSLAHQHLNQWPLAEDTVQQSLSLLNYHNSDDTDAIIRTSRSPFLLAQALNAHGRLHLAMGQAQRAAISWRQAADIYGELDDREGELGSRVNQVEAIATLGHYRQACHLLVNTLAVSGGCDVATDPEFDSLLTSITQSTDPSIQILGLRTLGNLLRVVGEVDRSHTVLEEALTLTQALPQPSDRFSIEQSILLGLGETQKAMFQRQVDILERTFQTYDQDPQTVAKVRELGESALSYYRQAADTQRPADVGPTAIPLIQRLTQRQAQAQSLQLLLDLRDWLQAQHQDITQETDDIQTVLSKLFPMAGCSSAKVTHQSLAPATYPPQSPLGKGGGSGPPPYQGGVRGGGSTTEGELRGCTEEEQLAGDSAARSPLPPSHLSIYAQLNIAQSLNRVAPASTPQGQQSWHDHAIHLTEQAVQDATNIHDQRAQSYSLGILGHLWEERQQWQLAQDSTQKALAIAQQLVARRLGAEDLTYQWQWQLGRLHTAQQQWQQSIEHYTTAFETLQSIRNDLVFLNPDVQFSFQDTVEPVYRELVDVLLRPESSSTVALGSTLKSQGAQRRHLDDALLQKARVVIDALQVAEVENFLGQACAEQELAVVDQLVDKADQTTALIYTIVLEDRLEVILKLPQRDRLLLHSVPISQVEVEETVAQLYLQLQQKLPFRAQQAKPMSRQVYDWLVAPFTDALADQEIQTLVFALDGPLQTIPMAALWDGDRYLIQSYAIATTPGLQLVNPAPLERRSLNALLAGWINPPHDSPLRPLPGVARELQAIEDILGETETLTDEDFTPMALESEINRRAVPIVHLATHGQFSSQTDQTFISTGDGDRLTLDQMGSLLRSRDETRPQPIQLLFLSACQTLTGDKRAALGMAGLAVRSGARSTIASLWLADDEATAELVTHFYQALVKGRETDGDNAATIPRSKASALRAAQLELLDHPYFDLPVYWANFVLLGDWL